MGSPYNFLDSQWYRYNLEPQIDRTYKREVGLPAGGSIVKLFFSTVQDN